MYSQPCFFFRVQYGEVVNAVILIEKGGTGMSRGCAFISYATEAQAQAAVTALDNQMTLPGAPYNLRVGLLPC
jgi:RNA recognition motif-containing protein